MTLRSPETAMVSGLLLFCPHGRGSWVSNTFLTPAGQQGGHFIGNGLLARYIQVAVDVGRHLDITVAQPLLHVLEGEAVTQQETGAAMAQFVKANTGQSVLLEQAGKMMGDIVRRERTPIRPFEYIRVFLIRLSK